MTIKTLIRAPSLPKQTALATPYARHCYADKD